MRRDHNQNCIHCANLPGEAQVTLADITASKSLGWAPKVGVAEGLHRTIAYLRERVASEKTGVRPS